MPINADKPHLWKTDTRASVDQFNQWFMKFAPKAYRDTRKKTIASVERGLSLTRDLATITPEVIKASPGILPVLRMATCPPLARDRLIGLTDSTKNLVCRLEEGKLPTRISPEELDDHLGRITKTLSRMLDVDILPWLERKRKPTKEERYRSSTIVADRLCGAGHFGDGHHFHPKPGKSPPNVAQRALEFGDDFGMVRGRNCMRGRTRNAPWANPTRKARRAA